MTAATLHTPRGAQRIDADRARARTLIDIAAAVGSPVVARVSNGVTVTADTRGFTVTSRHGARNFTPGTPGSVARLARTHLAALAESEPENRDTPEAA